MAIKDIYTNTHCGTKQNDRMPKALADDYIRIDERSLEDLVFQVAEFAKHVTFYDGSNTTSTWHDFFDFDSKADVIAKISKQIEEGTVSPHMALLLAFLKLYGKEQAQLNTLLKRNREFYYKEVLGFTPRRGSIGTVPIFFQLTKSVSSVFLPKGTLFDAGKDVESRPIYYSTIDDVTLNKAKITHCIKYTGEKLYNIELDEEKTAVISSDACTHYIYLSLPALDKLDGNISIKCQKEFNIIKAEYTTVEGWREFTTKRFPLSIKADEPHFSIYNKKVHSGTLDLNTPFIRLSCCNITDVLNVMDATKSLTFSVADSENFIITHRGGVVANNKGVQPFGTICQKGDSFTIKFPFAILQEQIENNKISDNADKAFVDITFNSRKKDTIESITNNPNAWTLTLNKQDSRSCVIELSDNTYNQLDYQLKLAKHIASNMKGSKLDSTPEPDYYSILELQQPIKVAYRFSIDNIQQCIINSLLGQLQVSHLEYLFFKADHIDSELYFHLSDMDKASPLSIHFLLDPFVRCETHVKCWSYYNGNQWKVLTISDIIKDTTDGLCRSGIVVLNINADNVQWLKASFEERYEFKKLQRIRTQTAELEFDRIASQGMPPVGVPLHSGTITRPQNTIPGIKTVMQPYDGNSADCDETHLQFECRVSEHLRHKGRAWTAWDYERLVLEHFPNIASVRCYPSSNSEGQLTPGSVFLVVIPQLDAIHQDRPLTPYVDSTTLNDIETYLNTVRPEHVFMTVENPKYDEISITCTISLCSGCIDKAYYTAQLDTALKVFLAPWTDSTQIEIGNKSKLNESDIVAFIQQQPYVDKIWHIQVKIKGNEVCQGTDILPSNIGHLLTSAPIHEINIKSNDEI